jgi:hypothetical protein
MNLPLMLMMVATALFQEVESPLGHCGVFDPEGGVGSGKEGEDGPAARIRQGMVDSIRGRFEDFESREAMRPDERGRLYQQMHKSGQVFDRQRGEM